MVYAYSQTPLNERLVITVCFVLGESPSLHLL